MSGRAIAGVRASAAGVVVALSRQRRVFVLVAGTGIAVAVTLALLAPPRFSASFSFLPQNSAEASGAGLATLAGQFGFNLAAAAGQGLPAQVYVDVLQAQRVLAPIVADSFTGATSGDGRVPLPEFLGVKGKTADEVRERTIDVLRRRVIATSVATRTTGMVTVRVQTHGAQASLELTNRLLAAVHEFNALTRRTQASAEREFASDRLDSARVSLREAENTLQRFLERNREFGGAPQLSFERDRLQREVVFRQELVSGLAKQNEEAKLREVRDTPAITMIDLPTLPIRPNNRQRNLSLLIGGAFSILAGMAMALLVERQRLLAARGDQTDWERTRSMLRGPSR